MSSQRSKGPALEQRSISSFFSPKSKGPSGSSAAAAAYHARPSGGSRAKLQRRELAKQAADGYQGEAPTDSQDHALASPASTPCAQPPPAKRVCAVAFPAEEPETRGNDEDMTRRARSSAAPAPRKGAKNLQRGAGVVQNKGAIAEQPVRAEAKGKVSPTQSTSGKNVVGRRLRVYWPLDRAWYRGRVKAADAGSGKHIILYDDGEEEMVDLSEESFRWEEDESGEEGEGSPRGRGMRGSRAGGRIQGQKEQGNEEDGGDASDEDRGFGQIRFSRKVKAGGAVHKRGIAPAKTGLQPKQMPGTKKRPRMVVEEEEEEESEESEDEDEDEDEEEDWMEVEGKKTAVEEDEEDGEMDLLDEEQEDEADTAEAEDDAEEGEDEKEPPPRSLKGKTGKGPTDKKASSVKGASAGPARSIASTLKDAMLPVQGLTPAVSLTGSRDAPLPSASEAGVGMDIELTGEAADRFCTRMEGKFDFLLKNRRDARGKRPGQEGYDPTTVSLPPQFLKSLSEGQKQWWQFKAAHMDKVLLFKMGKFYEMFEMDAHIGAKELDLQYMKGEQPHCGFPEKNYAENAERLARKGYRVLVVEQVETPEQLEQRKKATGAKDKVVRREVCAVLTRGTLADGEMLGSCPDPSYLFSLWEEAQPRPDLAGDQAGQPAAEQDRAVVGVCAADVATGQVLLGQVSDDSARTALRTLLAELRPVELVLPPSGVLSGPTERALRDGCRQPLISRVGLPAFEAPATLAKLQMHYSSAPAAHQANPRQGARNTSGHASAGAASGTPTALLRLQEAGPAESGAALAAFGGLLSYLRSALLDERVLGTGRMHLLPGWFPRQPAVTGYQAGEQKAQAGESADAAEDAISGGQPGTEADSEMAEPFMMLDCAALDNLEILENTRDGGHAGTLLAQLDHCVTAAGRKLLRTWLVRPLLSRQRIEERQSAVQDLKGPALDAMGEARKALMGIPDLERVLARIHAATSKTTVGRNAAHVVLYEDMGLSRVREFTSALRACAALLSAVAAFAPVMPELTSARLKHILPPGRGFPSAEELQSEMRFLEDAFDWGAAESTGRITPSGTGVDDAYDEALAAMSRVEENLQEHLEEQRALLKNPPGMAYANVGKDPYQLEVPESLHCKLPSHFELKSSRKGFRRYWTPFIREQLDELNAAQERREEALRGIYQSLLRRFCQGLHKWEQALRCVAELDALGSLASYSLHSAAPMCQPSFSPCDGACKGRPWLRARGLRHPVLAALGTSFVPNDTVLGGGAIPEPEPSFILLTGPNMGGKSTLLRQVCLAIVLAQIGADVPAESFGLSPVDRLFVRMGARDQIMAGQSTFLVELSETANMLRLATKDSFVALDELGRGTSTSDGQAIAHAVLEHIAHNIGCRGMFSTHYHALAEEHEADPVVVLKHMSCHVGSSEDHEGNKETQEVVFLYRLADGACPKSYGVNVARLAGMPESVLHAAMQRSEALEASDRHKEAEAHDVDAEQAEAAAAHVGPTPEEAGRVQTVVEQLFPALEHAEDMRALEQLQQQASAFLAEVAGKDTALELAGEE